jgi:hypothetical protein
MLNTNVTCLSLTTESEASPSRSTVTQRPIVEMTPGDDRSDRSRKWTLEDAPSLIPAASTEEHGMGRARTNERRSLIRVH